MASRALRFYAPLSPGLPFHERNPIPDEQNQNKTNNFYRRAVRSSQCRASVGH
jgi:hypothetical protein